MVSAQRFSGVRKRIYALGKWVRGAALAAPYASLGGELSAGGK